ncbi:MAG: response regulator [Deltaproteobacteria bacterium]
MSDREDPPGGRILLAADDDLFRDMLAADLRSDGHVVVEAEDGDELADHVEVSVYRRGLRPAPDVIISEIFLPGPSALRILEQIREEELLTPMILVAALVDEATRADACRLGATAVFQRPLDMAALRRVVADAIGARRRAEALGDAE